MDGKEASIIPPPSEREEEATSSGAPVEATTTAANAAPVAFKKRAMKAPSKGTIRVRDAEGGSSSSGAMGPVSREDDEVDDTVVVPVAKRSVTSAITSSSSSAEDGATGSSSIATTVYESSRTAARQEFAGGATHITELDTAIEKDARTILERNIKLQEEGVLDQEPGIYRGQSAYRSFVNKDIAQLGANKFTGTQGPIRAPSFVRSSARFDYQPDICKDYKETGFCGYGDQCKFLHDRGDYKTGWQLEREWDAQQAAKKRKLEEALKTFGDGEEGAAVAGGAADGDQEDWEVKDEDPADGLPFACFICRGDFVNPVVTLCGHYFCQKCVLRASAKDPRCPVCSKNMNGVFNIATKLIKKLKLLKG